MSKSSGSRTGAAIMATLFLVIGFGAIGQGGEIVGLGMIAMAAGIWWIETKND